MPIGRLLIRSAQLWGERPALIDTASGRSLTFRDLANAAMLIGRKLRDRGLSRGDRVALLGDATAEYLCTDYGIMAAGLVRVPLDPSLTDAELANQIEDSGARLLLLQAERASLASLLATKPATAGVMCASFDADALEQAKALPHPLGPSLDEGRERLASLNYTGGTSGEPKAVMLTHANLRAAVQNIVMARGMGRGDVMLNVRPLWPIAAIIVLAHLAAGGTVVLGGRFEPQRTVSLLREFKAAATSFIPTHLVRLLRDCRADDLRSLTALRSIDIGGAAVPLETFEQALDAFGPKIGVLYGLTEASWSCYQPPSAFDAPPEIRRARMKSVGRPVFGCDIMIASGGDADEPGEVLIRGAHVMQGYWQRPELTAAVLKDGWFGTGDLGLVDGEGVLSIVGRLKEVIRSGGKSVQPGEVEEVLCRFPGVAEASVVGLPDKEWGELVAAAVVAAPGVTFDETLLKRHCEAALSAHKRPKIVQVVGELPKSHYGKVQRGKVKAGLIEYRRVSTSDG
ncbi:MAG TPA: class I adenylate-forming enzyme family protein [Pseudolabrys sp.]|nr:class I adenylate-forming enzyme family protein [Pseudolabrys sp.]